MVNSDKTFIAVISYITIVGWIVALILYTKHETQFDQLHLRQALFLHLLSLIFAFIPYLNILNIVILIFWIIGIVYAAMGKKKPLPLLGNFALFLFKDF